jgi:hypothetical protein
MPGELIGKQIASAFSDATYAFAALSIVLRAIRMHCHTVGAGKAARRMNLAEDSKIR